MKGDDEDKDKAKRAMMDALMGLNLIYQIPIIGSGIEIAVNKARGERMPVESTVNPITSVYRKINKGINEGDWIDGVRPMVEIGIGAQLDPLIGLYNGAAQGFDENTIYDIMGISQSYRPSGDTKTEAKQKLESEQVISDINNFGMTREELKKSNPDMYKLYFPEEVEVNGKEKEVLSPMGGYLTPSEREKGKSKYRGGYLTPSEREKEKSTHRGGYIPPSER